MKLFRRLNELTNYKYERYLPTAFDDTLSLLEKINKVIEYLNVLISINNDMATEIEKLRDEFRELKEYLLNGGLENDVRIVLQEWFDNGKLSQIINDQVFGELNKRIDSFVRISDFVKSGEESDDNSTNVQHAINKAMSENKLLLWDRIVTVNKTLINIHAVRSVGNGGLTSNGNSFFPSIKNNQTNTIFVRENGKDNNDGLSIENSIRTIEQAFVILNLYGPLLNGNWVIDVGYGLYKKARYPKNLQSKNPVKINGVRVGHPAIPQTIITEGNNHLGHGLYIDGAVNIEINNIKFIGFNGNGGTSSGISVMKGAYVKLDNCHFENCFYGTGVMHGSNMEFQNGRFTNCGYRADGSTGGAGHRSMGLSRHYIGIQDGTDFSKGVLFENCSMGLLIMDNCSGHINTITVQSCNTGIRITNNSRINGTNNRFYDCIIAIETQNMGATNIGGTDFKRNRMNIRNMGGGRTTGQIIQGKQSEYNLLQEINVVEHIDKTYTTTYRKFYEQIYNYGYFKTTNSGSSLGKIIDFTIAGEVNGEISNKRIGATIRSNIHQNISIVFSKYVQGKFLVNGKIAFLRDGTQILLLEGGTSAESYRVAKEKSNLSTENMSVELMSGVDDPNDSIHIDYVEMRLT